MRSASAWLRTPTRSSNPHLTSWEPPQGGSSLLRAKALGEADDPGREAGGGGTRNREDVRRRTRPTYATTRLNRRSELNRPVDQGERAGRGPFQHSLEVYALLPACRARRRRLADLAHDPGRRALARAMITFAAELKSTIIAEGIEAEEQLQALRALGVGYGQGFYIARPSQFP